MVWIFLGYRLDGWIVLQGGAHGDIRDDGIGLDVWNREMKEKKNYLYFV